MDRPIWYAQETLRSYDLLAGKREAMKGLAFAVEDLMGSTATAVSGFAATPDTPADLSINLAPGRIYELAAADALSYGSLAADALQILQQGIAYAAQRVTLTTQQLSTGQSQFVLIEASFAQIDAIPSDDPSGGVLNYFNVNNPLQGFIGPNNNNQALNTVRLGTVEINVVYGTPATTGSEAPPDPGIGFVPLYLVDLTYGQTAITSGEILVAAPGVTALVPGGYPQAPFLAGLLNQHHLGSAGQAPRINLTEEVQGILPLANLPASSARAGGGLITWYPYAGTPQGNLAGTAAVAGVSPPDGVANTTNGALFICTGTGTASTATWVQVGQGGAAGIIWCGVSTGTANAVTLTPSPGITSLAPGMTFMFESATANTSATTVNISGTGAEPAKKESGGSLVAFTGGEFPGGDGIATITWDGTEFQLIATGLSILATLGIGAGLRNDGNGNLQADDPVTLVSSNQTLATTSHRMRFVATAAINASVPHSSALWNGWQVGLVAQGGSITINPYSTDTINGGSAGASYTLAQGMSATLTTDGAGHLIVYAIAGGPAFVAVIEFIGLYGDWLSNTTCHHKCDSVNAAPGLGFATYQGTALTFNFNGATTGINGMDIGSMPMGGDLFIYAAYNPTTGTWGCFGTTYGGGSRCYTGSNAPSGFTATCLMHAHKTDGAGHLQQFHQRDRRITHAPRLCIDDTAAALANTYQALSIAAFVPANATCISGTCGSSTTNQWQPVLCLALDANGTGARRCVLSPPSGQSNSIDNFAAASRYDRLPCKTGQTLYWKASDKLARVTLDITDYEF